MALPPRDRPKRKKPYTLPKSHVTDSAQRRDKPRAPRPTGVFARPPVPARDPIQQRVDRARQRTASARRRLPPRPLPHVPVIKRPTAAQTQAARKRITSAVNRAVGPGGSGAQRLARRRVVEQDFLDDPRMRQAIRHYAQAQADHAALGLARAYGVRGSRQRKLRAGREIVAQQTARDRFMPGPDRALGGAPHRALATVLAPFASGQGGDLTSLVGKGISRAASDVVNLPVNAARGVYETGLAGVDLSGHVPGTPWEGDTRRAEALAKALGEGFVGQLVQGDLEGASRAFGEHPVYSLLESSGAGQIAGRGAGAAARTGALGSAARRAASTAREDLALVPGTNQRVARSYSPNVLVKALQVLGERSQRRQGADPNVARESAVPFRGREHLLNREVDEFAAQAEGMRRRGRVEVAREARGIAPSRRAVERDVVAAVVEGRLGASVPKSPAEFRTALERERDRLQDVYRSERGGMSRGARLANREQVRALDRAIGDRRTLQRFREVFAAADEYASVASRLERGLTEKGALDSDQAMAARLRPYAVAVMGARHDGTQRAPAEMAARHEAARESERSAKESLDRASERVRRLAAERDRIVGRQSVKRGQDAQRGPLRAFHVGEKRFDSRGEAAAYAKRNGGQVRAVALSSAEAKRTGELERATRALHGARRDRRQAQARWKQTRRDRVKSNPKKYVTGLVDADGNRISTQQILEHIRANGGRMPAFMGHRRDTRGARSFFVNWFDRRQSTEGRGVRTGEAVRQGAYAADFRALVENLVRQQGVADAIGSFDRFVNRFGMTGPGSRPMTWEQAVKAAEDVEEATGVAMAPVRAVPARYDQGTRDAILQGQRTGSMPEWVDSLTERRLAEALAEPDGQARGARNVVLVPAQQVERFREHQQVTRGGAPRRLGHVFTSTFRGTVLPFSPKWLTGNVTEAMLRMVVAGVNPVTDALRGRRVFAELRKLDEREWREADSRLRSGLLYASGDRLNVHTEARDFEGTALATPAKVLAVTGRLPVIRETLGAIRLYQQAVFALNRGFEKYAQTAVVGKLARQQVRELNGSWLTALRLQEQAARQVASGLLGTPTQVRFARALDDTLGKYGRFSPSSRRMIQSWAPFAPWYLAAVRFVGYTLPVKHPLKTAILATAERAFEAETEEHRRDVPPGSLEATIPLKDGSMLDVARFSPFGAFTNLPAGVVDPLLPQISSAVAILEGRAWTGKPLQQQSREPVGRGQRAWLALYATLESILPGVAIGRRLQEHGETAYDDSTVFAPRSKPGSDYGASAAERVLNPFRPVRLGPPTSAPPAAPSPAQERPRTLDDEITQALDGLAAEEARSDPLDDEIDRALEQLAAP